MRFELLPAVVLLQNSCLLFTVFQTIPWRRKCGKSSSMKLIILPKEDGLLKESPNYVLGIIMLTEKENGALC